MVEYHDMIHLIEISTPCESNIINRLDSKIEVYTDLAADMKLRLEKKVKTFPIVVSATGMMPLHTINSLAQIHEDLSSESRLTWISKLVTFETFKIIKSLV